MTILRATTMKKDARVSVTFATKSLPSLQRETSLQIEISLITQITYRSGLIKIIKMANITPCSRMCTFRRSFGRSDFTIVNLLLPKLLHNPHICICIHSRGGIRLPSECDYLPKYSSLWRLSIDNRHKRECSAVDCAAKCHL